MKRILLISLTCIFGLTLNAQDNSTFTVNLSSDNAFGFAPQIFGSFGVKHNMDFTYYGIYWTNHAFSRGGSDELIETGIGLGFPFSEGKGYINPSIGFTHGLFTSTGSGALAEGIVPNVAMFYTGDSFEFESYIGFYTNLKDNGTTSNYMLAWMLPGLRITENISLGLHYENFRYTKSESNSEGNIYNWLGGYVKFTAGDKYTFRFSAGGNTTDGSPYNENFYKLAVGIPML